MDRPQPQPFWSRIDTDGKEGWCWIDLASEHVDLGDGLWMYASTQVRYDTIEARVVVWIGVEEGRLVATRVEIDAGHEGPIKPEHLRKIPLAHLISWGADGIQSGEWGAAKPTHEEADYVSRHGMDDTSLRVIARVYRIAYLRGEAPTKTVEEMFGLPRSTAGRWVAEARKRGLLSESKGPGKAGA